MTAADGFLSAATAQGDLSTIEIRNGDPLQTIGFGEVISTNLISINYSGNRRLMIPKSSNSNAAVVFGTATGNFFCMDMETLEEIWKNNSSTNAILGTPVVSNNKIIFFSTIGDIYCVDARDGILIWKYSNKNTFDISKEFTPVTDGKTVFFNDVRGNTFALDINLGKLMWIKNHNSGQSIGISKDLSNLYIKSRKDIFHIINSSNGKIIKSIGINYGEDHSISSPVQLGEFIFVPAENGKIYRVNNKYNYKTILNLGTAPVISLQIVDENKLLATNVNGRIVLFTYSE